MGVDTAEQIFLAALSNLRSHYAEHTFWVERDVVCWLQLQIRIALPPEQQVFNDFGILPGPRRAFSSDLAIVEGNRTLLAAEFKFEPASTRSDIKANKLPVIDWVDVLKDIDRIEKFVAAEAALVAWSVCIDEGGRYRTRPRPPHSQVEDWSTGYPTHVTLTRWPSRAPS